MKQTILSWSRESTGKGEATRHPCKGVSNAITTFVGSGITGDDGLCNTQPYIVQVWTV